MKLKPCPFCGCEDDLAVYTTDFGCYGSPLHYYVQCDGKCGATGKPARTKATAIKWWNRRAKPEVEK